MFKKAAEAQIIQWIQNAQLDLFGKYLISSTVHGKPGIPLAEIVRIGKILQKNFSDPELFELGQRLLKRSEYTARRIGASLLAKGWPHKKIDALLKLAADDEDWQVRETAAGVFADLLEKDFSYFSKLFEKWVRTESDNVKRAVALAVKYDSRSQDPEKWKTYFKLIDPLMSEEAEYIRKNLGPFAIGDGLLSRYSKQTLEASQKWARSKDEFVRWNTAMIFTAAAAKKFPKEGRRILSVLIEDKSPFVSKAAQKALKNLS